MLTMIQIYLNNLDQIKLKIKILFKTRLAKLVIFLMHIITSGYDSILKYLKIMTQIMPPTLSCSYT